MRYSIPTTNDDWKVLYAGTQQEKLNYLSREVQKLQAENAALKAERDEADASADNWEDEAIKHMEDAAKYRAENAVLRMALERITRTHGSGGAISIAKKALQEGE